ncbi:MULTISPECIES: hypothetical protein [Chlamydia]|uniref:Inner membrane protein n=2 Tax=Chlamydia TaxID=810 RepID=A0ABP2X2T1_CHLPS|nr:MULTISPECIES: hypothetical protein [Chlamydia]AFS19361.1 putative inner membrane protein [Chlamydia psittaci 84/55]AGE74916.1 putative inner membrane protein [Chlamydia psittaci Mat116]EPJ15691.1 putative inner membrane protein [Chlamydia psittaci 02DC18]EPP32000.1 putative inner membrane protein [Chlamydia psittaci C1/97]ADZ18218.1 hypothetical protein CPSIT_0366 [Chlamydia psittaci 6BC]
MHMVSTIIPAHTHVSKNGAQIHLQTSPNLHVPKNRLDPSTTSARVEKILSLLPVVGLFVAGYLIYQKHTVMKDAYSRLGYTPNEKCPNLTCSNLDPSRLNFAITMSIFGGLGLLFPIVGLFGLVCLIMHIVLKIIGCCYQRSQTDSMLPT